MSKLLLDTVFLILVALLPGLSTLAYFIKTKKTNLVLLLLGGGGWLIALLARTPILYALSNTIERTAYLVVASYSAGLFEESLRYLVLKTPLSKKLTEDAVALGLSWGLTEALFIYVLPITIYTPVGYSLLELLPGALERNIALLGHIVFSLIVLKALSKIIYLPASMLAHGSLNIVGVVTLDLTKNVWLTETLLGLSVLLLFIATLHTLSRNPSNQVWST
ncbi:MAG: YhfC family glutamic-type intramembrane protease [Zestosphaera sp.]